MVPSPEGPTSAITTALVESAIRGEESAIEQLAFLTLQWLRREISCQLQSNGPSTVLDPEDVLQNVLRQVFRSLSTLRNQTAGGFVCWVRTIMLNLIRDALRHKQTRKVALTSSLDANDGSDEQGEGSVLDRTAARDLPADEEMVRKEFALLVSRAAQEVLTPREIQMLELRGSDLKPQEIATQLGTKPGIVSTTITRAKAKVLRKLREEGQL